jgi:hypothetical protein
MNLFNPANTPSPFYAKPPLPAALVRENVPAALRRAPVNFGRDRLFPRPPLPAVTLRTAEMFARAPRCAV